MQIHEITFGAKKLNEGLLDTVKAATKAVTTSGAKAVTSRVPYTQAKRDIDLSQAEKLRQQINAKYGVNVQGSKPTTLPPTAATGVPPATPGQTGAGVGQAGQLAGWANLPGGVQIKPATGKNPTLARYKKNLYSLSKNDQWIDQSGRPVNVTLSAFLDQALEQM
jgi:hypothetical protein